MGGIYGIAEHLAIRVQCFDDRRRRRWSAHVAAARHPRHRRIVRRVDRGRTRRFAWTSEQPALHPGVVEASVATIELVPRTGPEERRETGDATKSGGSREKVK